MIRRRGHRARASAALAAVLIPLLAVAFVACGGKSKRSERAHASQEAPAPPVPTPDNTPIDVLRTPAGLVLKTDESAPPGKETTPVPAATAPKATP